ncbi:MAG: anthranilate phosphoribosyltransferase [Chitinophagales bacterium]
MFEQFLHQVVGGGTLSAQEAYQVANMLLRDSISDVQASAFLTAMRVRRENEEELFGFVQALQEHTLTVKTDLELIDTCGTGGDGHSTFNISTATALVVAACGVPVAKHGNRAVTSRVGSADVLETLGVRIDLKPDEALSLLEKVGITFLFAPYYHPIMKQVSSLRKSMGIATIFNFLGPLINPFPLTYQVMGVADQNIQGTIARALAKLGRKRALVVHAANGMDEISPVGQTLVYDVNAQEINTYYINPLDYGITPGPLDQIHGANTEVNARIIMQVLEGQPGACREAVLLNSAAALVTAGKTAGIADGLALAGENIDSGKALNTLRNMISYSRDGVTLC